MSATSCRSRLLSLALGLASLALVLAAGPRAAAAQTDIIRGRVTGPDSQPVPNVSVTATSMSGGVTRGTKTDRNGRFTITFPGDEGDYLVSFAALGYAPRRFEVKRSADQEILVADARLQAYAARLDTMRVTGKRDKVNRNAVSPDISGTEHGVDAASLPADQATDLAALAASLPGVQLIPGADGSQNGFSVLGLTADQNNMTLNGLDFSGSNLPRDAQVSTTLVTSPYDVSRGGFSGGQFSLRTRPGSNYEFRSLSFNTDQPSLQFTDPAGRALGQRFSNYSLGGLMAGPLVYDKAFYNVAYQLGRRANDLQTPLNTDPLGLRTAGIAPDSIQRLLAILQQQAIPATVGGIPDQRITDRGSLFGSLDFNPPFSTSGQTFNVTSSASWNRTNPMSGSTSELPAHSGERTNWNGSLQGRHSAYLGSVLTETTLGVSASRNYGTPYLQLPSGVVLVNSSFADGSTGLERLLFGGSANLNTTNRTSAASFLNALSWFSENNKHRLKLQTELRRDGFAQDQTTNQLGTFSFNSLADLQAGQPASFTRQLSPRRVSGSQLVGAVSLGDAFRKSADLQFNYGLRLDGNRFLYDPALNGDVERVFGVRNDHAPNRLYVSPRIGFSWQYGQAAQIGAFQGAFRGPRAVVRGGIGVFQSTPAATLLSGAAYNTGLPGSLQQLSCVGPAAPVPDWSAYAQNPATIPSACADGSTGTPFATSAPNVTLFDPGFAAPRSVRSNLNWQGLVLNNRFSLSVDAQYSMNLDQQGFVDLNFRPSTEQFTLAGEGNRPVFVSPSSIVPATGAIAPGDARVSPQYSHVTELRSDLRSESRQLTLSLSPFSFNSRLGWNLSYVYLNVRDLVHGFSSTAGNPLDRTWGRSSMDFRHQFQYSLFYNAFDALRISWFGRISAGTPYTPMVAGDVNGDGYANDRAYIFDPAATSDTALAGAMRQLLDRSRGSVRHCLLSQLGTLAARNSCVGPWTHTATMMLSFNSLKLHLPQRSTLSLQISNPLGAADLLLHGENRLHGWGQVSFPDQSLLYPRGFDPASQSFAYRVNQRFGATNPAFTTFRAPVVLTAMLRFDIGPSRERQALTMQLNRGRRSQGQRLPEPALMMLLSQGMLPNPLANLLRNADTLKLTQQQADSIAVLNRNYTIKIDSIWAPVAKYLADLPEQYDGDVAYDRYRHAREQAMDVLMRLAPGVRSLLTREQYRKLPPYVSTYLDTRFLASIRSGTAGGGGMAFFPMGAVPAAAGAMVIIRQ
ncbi:MAG TPA: TonB-dependent receptor [Gemmatimonadaceae bacterium]|nr:TonB-dependent receptor [Gemmatimonadaceae bacterium]